MKLPFIGLAALALLGAMPATAAVPGFAGNITGGGNKTPIVVNTFAEMQAAMNNYRDNSGLVLHYTGTFDEAPILANICGQWSKPRQEININDKSGVTILGMDGSSANFAIRIRGSSNNIIIRNMKMGLVPGGGDNGDIVGIEAESHHVWFDHNELYSRNVHCPGTPGNDTTFDGALDIKASATNITVSYNYFHDHAKVGLDGSGDSDDFERRITYAHNRYENVGSRLPLQRFGYIHVYNNYYNGITESGINVRMTGHALIENNWFENALNPVTSRTSEELGNWDLRNNNAQSAADNARYNLTWNIPSTTPFRNADNWQTTATFPITLPYTYTTYPPEVSRCIAINAAGAGKGLREAADVLSLCGGGTTSNLALSPTSLSFAAAAGSSAVAVTANVSWTAVDDQSWLSVAPASGSNNGSITVSATANTGTTSRSGVVTVSGGGITRTIAVTQSGQTVASTVYQMENGTVGGGTVLETKNAGFLGTGYVNSSTSGGFAQVASVDGGGGGTKTLRIRYALASGSRTGRLLVNGVARSITFNSTGAWTTWQLLNVTVTLNNNAANTIRFESSGQDLANLDQVEVL
jgi:pectate lyase